MPWTTPTLLEVRSLVRDAIRAKLPGADALVPNSVLRVLSDNQGALCHATLQYIDWLALQLLPDTAETEWLDRHGKIWLVNSDGSTGRKSATLASGTATFTGVAGTIIPVGQQGTVGNIGYETTAQITTGSAPAAAPMRALDPGTAGNLNPGDSLELVNAPPGADTVAVVVEIDGGTDDETDEELRVRVLQRIQNPPMGGSQADYVAWAMAVPGVTRAWAACEIGPGTVTVRFLMDDLRADNNGYPLPADIITVSDYINKMRPVTVKDTFVFAPIQFFMDVTISNLNPNTGECKAEIEAQLDNMLLRLAAPGQTIYSAWVSAAIMQAPSVISFDLVTNADYVMPNPASMALLGTILYE